MLINFARLRRGWKSQVIQIATLLLWFCIFSGMSPGVSYTLGSTMIVICLYAWKDITFSLFFFSANQSASMAPYWYAERYHGGFCWSMSRTNFCSYVKWRNNCRSCIQTLILSHTSFTEVLICSVGCFPSEFTQLEYITLPPATPGRQPRH